MMELLRYQRENGREPFTDWLATISDKVAQARLRVRLRQIEAGNFGDCAPVGVGVIELRVHVGPGFRIYCGLHGRSMVLLLCGGNKSRQKMDIKRANELWAEWKLRQV